MFQRRVGRGRFLSALFVTVFAASLAGALIAAAEPPGEGPWDGPDGRPEGTVPPEFVRGAIVSEAMGLRDLLGSAVGVAPRCGPDSTCNFVSDRAQIWEVVAIRCDKTMGLLSGLEGSADGFRSLASIVNDSCRTIVDAVAADDPPSDNDLWRVFASDAHTRIDDALAEATSDSEPNTEGEDHEE